MNQNALYALQYLQEKYKYAPHQAAGIVGNLMQESGLNTGARNGGDGADGSDSIGIAQWNSDRAAGLKNFAANRGTNWDNLDTQLDYIHHEMQGPEKGAYKRLMAAQDVDGATQAFLSYERPYQWWSAPTGWSRANLSS